MICICDGLPLKVSWCGPASGGKPSVAQVATKARNSLLLSWGGAWEEEKVEQFVPNVAGKDL